MNEILSYLEMCQREGISLQKGMNYQIGNRYSIILMSVRPNAPYRDRFENDDTLIYEGHDIHNKLGGPDPKSVDQPEYFPSGSLTENGKFFKAAQDFKIGLRKAELVRVYEKIKNGIWSDNGLFELVDAWRENDGKRQVFKFRLVGTNDMTNTAIPRFDSQRSRLIPTTVKLEVWKRDGGKCVTCGASDELHFDHVIPFSRGGTSLRAENIQLLCARHNLEKRDKIQ